MREEVELQEARVRVLEHYEEVIVLDDEATGESRLLAASAPEPLIDRCYVGVALLAYLAASRFAASSRLSSGKRSKCRAST